MPRALVAKVAVAEQLIGHLTRRLKDLRTTAQRTSVLGVRPGWGDAPPSRPPISQAPSEPDVHLSRHPGSAGFMLLVRVILTRCWPMWRCDPSTLAEQPLLP
jgi:hypothetical protein